MEQQKKLFFYGATAQAKMAIEVAERLDYSIGGCIDKSLLIESVLDYPVALAHQQAEDNAYFVAIRNAGLRARTCGELVGADFVSLIDPQASVSRYAEVEEGTVIFARATVHADVQIGAHVLIDSGAVVASNTIIEDFVNIGAQASIGANVLIGKGSEIGAHAVLMDEVTIPAGTIIAPASVVGL